MVIYLLCACQCSERLHFGIQCFLGKPDPIFKIDSDVHELGWNCEK